MLQSSLNSSREFNDVWTTLHLVLNVSVDVRVPEQGLVTITPEEVSGSNVLVLVLLRPLLVRQVSQVLSVLSMLKLDLGHWNSSQNENWDSNKVGDFLPQSGDTSRVSSLVLEVLDVLLTGGLVVLALEWVFLEVFGDGAVAVGGVSLERTLSESSKHCEFYWWGTSRQKNSSVRTLCSTLLLADGRWWGVGAKRRRA